MTPPTGILARILSSILPSIRPMWTLRSAKNNMPFFPDSGVMRCMLILFVANHVGRSLAWTWTTHQTPPDAGLRNAEDTPSIFDDASNDALQSYSRKPDCFQDAIASVKARCEESRMDEQERIQAAIGMTMCELATARHYLPPMECAAYAQVGHKPAPPTPQGQARCVDALSRSAQFWSSYSGYLREIPQLCFTFRRWIDIDTAKDIYRNITEEKAIFLRFLMEREKGSKTTQQRWERTTEDMRDMLEAFRLASNGMRDTSDMLTNAILNNSQSLLTEVQNTIEKIEDRDRTNHGEIMTKFYSMLEGVERKHSDHLLGLLPAIQSSIVFEVNTALALITDENLRNIDAAAHLERRLSLLEGGLSVMQNSLEQLVGVVQDSSKSLEASLEQARTAQVIQGDTTVSMAHLVDTVHSLTRTTHAEIAWINRTTSALKESLDRSPGSEWIKAVLASLLQLFPGLSLFDSATNSHPLHLTFRLVNALWHGTRFLVSLLVSIFILANARGRPSFALRAAPDDREEACAALEQDTKPLVHRPTRPRTRQAQRSFRSRIPDRLCRPREDDRWL